MVRRPTAYDREVAEVLANLKPGTYRLTVESPSSALAFMGLARIKSEGSTHIDFGPTTVLIEPVKKVSNG